MEGEEEEAEEGQKEEELEEEKVKVVAGAVAWLIGRGGGNDVINLFQSHCFTFACGCVVNLTSHDVVCSTW